MIRAALTATGLLSLTIAGALAPRPESQVNYAAIPPAPEEVVKQLEICKIPLAQAVETAVKSTGGMAKTASVKVDNGLATIEVLVYGNGKCQRVLVDGQSGAVQSTTEVPRFAGEPVSGQWTELPSGLKYYDLAVGTGEKPVDPMTTVTVLYTGWLVDGTKFDSSVDRNKPYVKPLGEVIKGLTEGISTMRVGGKRKLIIPPKLAYGNKGFGDRVPPRATLVFDIELLGISK